MKWLSEFYIHHTRTAEAHLFLFIVLFVVFSIACNKWRKKKEEEKKRTPPYHYFYLRDVSIPQEKILYFMFKCSSSIVCSIDVQTVWLILFCIVVITNRGLSCTVYLLTGQSYVWETVKKIMMQNLSGWRIRTLVAGS